MKLVPVQLPSPLQCVRLAADPDSSAPDGLSVHRAAILWLTATLQRPPEEVAQAYCEELSQMEKHAKVIDFLPILAAKQVRTRYRLTVSL